MLPALLACPELARGVHLVQLLADFLPVYGGCVLNLNDPQKKVSLLGGPGGSGDAGGRKRQKPELASLWTPSRKILGYLVPVGCIELIKIDVVKKGILVDDVEEVVGLIEFPVFAGEGGGAFGDESF